MAHKGASAGRGLSDDRRLWDEDFARIAFEDFDFPRHRITGGKGRTEVVNGRMTANGSANGATGRTTTNGSTTGVNGRTIADAGSIRSEPGGRGRGVPGRRTVTIRGYGAERNLPWTAGQSRRRPAEPRHQRPGFRADRAAMWAVLLGIMLVIVAAASSHAAVLRGSASASPLRAAAGVSHQLSLAPSRAARPGFRAHP